MTRPMGNLTTQVAIPAAVSTAEQWVMDNWGWIVVVTLAVIIIPPVLKKI